MSSNVPPLYGMPFIDSKHCERSPDQIGSRSPVVEVDFFRAKVRSRVLNHRERMLTIGRVGASADQTLVGCLVVPMVEEHGHQSQRIDFGACGASARRIDVLQLPESPPARFADFDGFSLEIALGADVVEIAMRGVIDAPVEKAR